jgi:hypothetical protein
VHGRPGAIPACRRRVSGGTLRSRLPCQA